MMRSEMGPVYLASLMQTVPAYTECEMTLESGKVIKGLARDLPQMDGTPRRWTVDGWEWFIDAETFMRVGVTDIKIELPSIKVVVL